MNQLMLQDGIHYLKINGIMHWCKSCRTTHNTVPLIIVHGGPGGNHYVFEKNAWFEVRRKYDCSLLRTKRLRTK